MEEEVSYDQEETVTGTPEPLQKLYEVVHEKGLYTKTFDEFKSKYSKPEEQEKLFNVVSQQGFYTKSKEEFNKKYFSGSVVQIPKFQLDQKPISQPVAKESTGVTPTVASADNARKTKDLRTHAEQFSEKAKIAKATLQKELASNEDVVVNTIREGRYLKAKEEGFTDFAQSARSDMPKTGADIYAAQLLPPEEKPQDAPVTREDIELKKQAIATNEPEARQHLANTAKMKPEKKSELEKAAYLADKASEIEQGGNPERIAKIYNNAEKIGKGQYTYDIAAGGAVKRPEGFFDSIVTGIGERRKQMSGYDDVKDMSDAEAADYFDKKAASIDPDEPIPMATGAGEVGQMFGTEWASLAKGGVASAIVGRVAPQAAPFVSAAINAPEYYKRGYYSTFEQTYHQLLSEGKPREEAIKLARQQAETEGKIDAAEGAVSSFIGARVGLKPLPKFNLTGGFKKAIKNVLAKTAHYGGEAALEGTVDGLVAGYLQDRKNMAAKEIGIFRSEGEGIVENIKGELLFSLAMAGATKAGSLAVDPKTYKTLLYNLTKQPEAAVDQKLGEWIQEGKITEEDASETKKAINNEKKIQSQIPEDVTEEAREKIREKIDKRNQLQEKADQLDDAFKPALKEKIKEVNEEIVELSKDKEKPSEDKKIIRKAIEDGRIPDVLAGVAKDNPESFYKFIADQALGRTETGEMSTEPNADESVRQQFGDDIVDKALELFPFKNQEPSQEKQLQDIQSGNAAPFTYSDESEVAPTVDEVVIETPDDFDRELTKAINNEAQPNPSIEEEIQKEETQEVATTKEEKTRPAGSEDLIGQEVKIYHAGGKVTGKVQEKAADGRYLVKDAKGTSYLVKPKNIMKGNETPTEHYERTKSLPRLGSINDNNNQRPSNEDVTEYTTENLLNKAKEFYKDDQLINRVVDFLEPILSANPNIKIDTGFKWDKSEYEGSKITNQALGYSFPSGNLILNFDAISDYDTLYRTALHEMVHAATRAEIDSNSAFNDELKIVLSDVRKAMGIPDGDSLAETLIRNKVISEDYDNRYGAANEHELLAEVFTNDKFFNFLKGLEYKGDNLLHKLFLAIAKFFSDKYKQIVGAKENISANNLADYLIALTESVVSGKQETLGEALPAMRNAERDVLKSITQKAIGKISEEDIRGKLKQIAGLEDSEIDELLSEVSPKPEKPILDRALTPDEIGKTPVEPKRKSAAKKFKEKYFDRAHGLPDWILKLKDKAKGTVHLEVRQALQLVDETKKTAKKIGFDDWAAFDKAIREQYYGSDFSALKSLPEDMQVLAVQMRNKVDSLSRDLIINNYVTPEQALNIESNIGEYLTRSYRAFSEKDWGKKVPQKAKDDAYRLLVQEIFNEKYNDRSEDLADGTVTEDELIEEAKVAAFRELQSIIDGISDRYTPTKTNVEKGKDLGILKQRKDIPKEIRELLGEYTDPGVNFAITVARIAQLKSQSEYLNSVKDQGMGEIFFEGDTRPSEASVQIKSEGSQTWNPLNGLYTTPEVKEVFEEAEVTRNWAVRTWLKTVGAIKWGKTVGSVVTQVKNFESNLGFALMNGHFNAGKSKEAFKFLKDKLFDGEKSRDQLIEKVIGLGLVDQSVGVRELKNMFETDSLDKVILNSTIRSESPLKKIRKGLGKSVEYLNKVYGASDDFWKVYGFLNEAEALSQAQFGKSYKKLSPDEQTSIDTEASERVKNTYPTYDRVWEGAKYVSKNLPIFGNFLSFQAESIRVLLNTFDYAVKDMKTPSRKMMGAKRIAGIGSYMGARSMILYTIAQMTGVGMAGLLGLASDDDEDQKLKDINRYSPDFIRSGDKLAIDKGDGNYTVYDVGGLEPYGIWFKTMNAYTEGNDLVKQGGIGAAATELLSPFFEPEMSFKMGLNLYNNKNDFGSRIYNPTDGLGDQMLDAMKFIATKAEPSTIDFIKRVYSKEDKQAEMAAMFGGRPYHVETVKSFSFKLKAAEELFDANRDALNKVKYSPESTEDDIQKAQQKFEERTNKIIKTLAEDYQSAIRLGAKIEKLDETIDRKKFFQGYNKDVKNKIKSGVVDEEKSSDEIKEWEP